MQPFREDAPDDAFSALWDSINAKARLRLGRKLMGVGADVSEVGMRTLAALISILAVAWLTYRLRPVAPVPPRACSGRRGAAVQVGRRWIAVRVQIGGVL